MFRQRPASAGVDHCGPVAAQSVPLSLAPTLLLKPSDTVKYVAFTDVELCRLRSTRHRRFRTRVAAMRA
jgi:hypothetical protein